MRLLVLGGTGFLGRHLVRSALERGAAVDCLARGRSGSLPDGARLLRGDRDRDAVRKWCEAEPGTRWDAVVDLAGRPEHAAAAARALAGRTGRWLFVSTVNVYRDAAARGGDETDAVLAPTGETIGDGPEHYPAAKAACETAWLAGAGEERGTILRPGLVGGPGDPSGRSGYWPWRLSRRDRERAVAPDAPDAPLQIVDVRDLADFVLHLLWTETAGVFDAVGERTTLGRALELAGSRGPGPSVLRADPAGLLRAGVAPWSGPRSLPLWIPDPALHGWLDRSGEAAVRAGLRRRPLARTFADTLPGERERRAAGPAEAGLTDAEEDEVIRFLHREGM